ncbi:hypothetical protein [Treponema sp.]|uniref:hypothetical protein n=1 Tax=Treponema sp. TaxID=166 RepID=UPI00388D520C
MTSLPKIALSMLISVIVFAGCLFFSFAGGFRLIEVQYYTPRVIGNINDRLEKIKSSYGDYFTDMDEQFRKFLSEPSVSSYIEREPSRENMDERDNLCGLLFQKNAGLDGMRLIENDGIHVHFSTFQDDVLTESTDLITYANYTDRIPFALIEAGDGEKNTKVYFDNAKNRLLFSYPFYDVYTACRGTMVFYVAGDDFTRFLIGKDVVSLNARGTVLSPSGFVFNIPLTGRTMLIQEIQKRWEKRTVNIEQLVESDVKRENLFVVSTTSENGIKIGWICSQDEFEFSEMEKFSLLVCLFMTLFLIVFLLFNIRHDDMVLIRRRIRKFQYGLLKEYIERKDSSDWKSLSKEIASRRMDVNDEIKRSLGRRGKKHSVEIDEMLEESWQDIMSAVGATSSRSLVDRKPDETKDVPVVEIAPVQVSIPQPVEEVEELEEIEEAEPVEETVELEDFVSDGKEADVVIEQTFSEYAKEARFPDEKIKSANADEIKQKSMDSFSVSDLNFSNLDGEN